MARYNSQLATILSILLAFIFCSSVVNASDSSQGVWTNQRAANYNPQNTAANFAGVYSQGGCVPAPVCPAGSTPSIVTAPLGAAGVTSASGCSSTYGNSCTTVVTTALYSYRTFAVGNNSFQPTQSPNTCGSPYASSTTGCPSNSSTDPSTTLYWRVCLIVTGPNGIIPYTSSTQAQLVGSILAITRCMPTGGDIPSGSAITGTNLN
jgi:hypothetical protein